MPDTTSDPSLDFRAIFEAVQSPCLVLLPDTPRFTIVAASETYLAATMTSRESLQGRGLFEVFPDNPDDPAATGTGNLRSSLERVLESRAPHTMAVQKYDIPRPPELGGGFEERHWSPVNAPALASDGTVRYLLHRVEDVTDFIRLRQQRAELSQELDSRTERMEAELYQRAIQVQEANRELARKERELTRLNVRLRRLDDLKSRFFANVSHELRTPLTLLLAPLHTLLAAAGTPSEVRRELVGIQRNARILLDRVNDLLEVARLEAGKVEARYVQVDLSALVRQGAGHFSSLALERSMDFRVEAPDSTPAQVDPDKFLKILMNLLSNAFKFTPPSGGVVCALSREGGDAVLEVADSGPGIPPELRERVFERFFQAEESDTRRHAGTGLGLAIAREFATLHSGSLEADASPAGGALLRLRIPLAAPEGVAVHADGGAPAFVPALEDRAEAPLAQAPQDERAPTVLVVEDNEELAAYICRALAGRFRTLSARDGREGLEKALAHRPDLILTDVMMPGTSGPQMIREIRSQPALDGVPIVVLTARAEDALRVELLRSDVQDYLVKPFTAEELEVRIGNQVRLKRSREELEETYRDLQATQVQLVHSAKMAALGQLVAGIAHEINNPTAFALSNLHSVKGWLERLAPPPEEALDPARRALWSRVSERLGSAERGLTRIRDLVIQLLTFSRLDQGEFETVEVPALVDSVVCFLEHRLADGVTLRTRYGPVTRLDCYPGLLNQVLVNLLGNALDALDGGGKVEIATDVDGPNFRITVSDSGPGIPPENLDRLFEPFFTTKPVGQGTGLGLAISYSLMQVHQGRIVAGNGPDGGAWFRLEIPVDLARRRQGGP